jgi:GT2 family glycosyltransferase
MAPPRKQKVRSAAVPEISVVVPTYSRAAGVTALLSSLATQTLDAGRFEVVVVDDCSTDDTFAVVSALAGTLPFELRLVQTPSNSGQPAPARNVGWREAKAPLLAFIDDDVTPSAEWLEAGLAALRAQPEAGVIQGWTYTPADVNLKGITYGPPNWQVLHTIEGPSPYFESCNIFFRREALEATGGFEEGITYWGEDTILGWKVLAAGWERGFAPEAKATHPVDQRGFEWFVRKGLLENNFVRMGSEFPGFRRDAFWRPWAFRREDPALLVAIIGLVLGVRFRPALVLALPYMVLRRPSPRRLSFFRLCLQIPVLDAARVLAHLRGSLEYKTLVL